MRSINCRGSAPPSPIAADEDNAAQNPPVIDPKLAIRLEEESGQACHRCVRQPVEIAHVTTPFSEPWSTRRSDNQ